MMRRLITRLGRKFCKNQGIIIEEDGKFYSKRLDLVEETPRFNKFDRTPDKSIEKIITSKYQNTTAKTSGLNISEDVVNKQFYENFTVMVRNTSSINTVERTRANICYKTTETKKEEPIEVEDIEESSNDSLLEEFNYEAEEEKPPPKKMGFKLFRCAKIANKKKQSSDLVISPARLQSPNLDKYIRRRIRGHVKFKEQLKRKDFIEQSNCKIHDIRLESTPQFRSDTNFLDFSKTLPRDNSDFGRKKITKDRSNELSIYEEDRRFISNKRIPGPDFGKVVGRDKHNLFMPFSNVKKDYLEDLLAKIEMKKSREDSGPKKSLFKPKRVRQNLITLHKVKEEENSQNKKVQIAKKQGNPTSNFVELLVDKGYLDIGTKAKSRYKNSTILTGSYRTLVDKIVGSNNLKSEITK
ncbi:unnamed protein product [Moneuplotes crassus]|uniref:Uncharacterized protein n=1 Tax=Euplotes crassus TaxID=5936 RepID=A0AAD1UF16_EUPCR|nr:unnamed protein product [Moneuplotes crassus]